MAKVNKVVAPKSFLLKSEDVPLAETNPESPRSSDKRDDNHNKRIGNKRETEMTNKSKTCDDDSNRHRSVFLDMMKAPLLCRNLLIMGYNW